MHLYIVFTTTNTQLYIYICALVGCNEQYTFRYLLPALDALKLKNLQNHILV